MKKPHHKEPGRIEMSEADLEKLIEEIRASSLSENSKHLVIQVLLSFLWLNRQLLHKTLSIKKLMRILFGSKTEKVPKKEDDQNNPPPPSDDPPPPAGPAGSSNGGPPPEAKSKSKGHGKNDQANFEAVHVPVAHTELKVGDLCPECHEGRLYAFGSGSVLRFIGQQPIAAIVYEPERLRCALCQVLLTAPLPKEAGDERFQPSAKAMVAILTSGAGLPAYRLEGLQKSLGAPLPDSTQFDLREEVANTLSPVHKPCRF